MLWSVTNPPAPESIGTTNQAPAVEITTHGYSEHSAGRTKRSRVGFGKQIGKGGSDHRWLLESVAAAAVVCPPGSVLLDKGRDIPTLDSVWTRLTIHDLGLHADHAASDSLLE